MEVNEFISNEEHLIVDRRNYIYLVAITVIGVLVMLYFSYALLVILIYYATHGYLVH